MQYACNTYHKFLEVVLLVGTIWRWGGQVQQHWVVESVHYQTFSLSLSLSRLLLLSRSAHDGRHISYVSAPTETETTHTGHERVSVDLKSAKIKGSASGDRPSRSEIRVYGGV